MPWEPIAIASKEAVDVEGDEVRVVWSLSRQPNRDWAREFRNASVQRSGSQAFLTMPSPDIRTGGAVQWTVPAADLEGAVRYVKACVEAANRGYDGILTRREEEHRRREEEQRVKAMRLEAAQQALNALD